LLIIFDLDDTLIDTSGSVTPFKMKECLKCLISAGLCVEDFEKAYADLLALNGQCAKSKETLVRFVSQFGRDAAFAERAIKELFTPLPSDFQIPTTPHAKEILEYFRESHTLAIVTGGHPPFQMEKLKKAGIDTSIFSKIAIPEDSIKKPFYEGLLKEFSLSPHQVFVCGDRVAMDLVPAYELGFKTVHMKWGRGTKIETEKWIHHSISDLSELKGIIAK
jgi:FMN phosphatase YigB (HAD superfamily)